MPRIKKEKKAEAPKGKSSRAKRESAGPSEAPIAPPRKGETEPFIPAVSGEANPDAGESGPAPVENQGVEQNTVELLSFRLADEEYAVDLLKIKEIIRLTEITKVPRAPNFIEGIISLRGTVIPIFGLRDRLGLRRIDSTRKSRIIIAKLEGGLMGFITDEVTDVMKVAVGDIEAAPGAKEDMGHLIGVLHFKDRMVIYMDMDQVVGTKAVQ